MQNSCEDGASEACLFTNLHQDLRVKCGYAAFFGGGRGKGYQTGNLHYTDSIGD